MAYSLITSRLCDPIRRCRLNRGYTQAQLASLARITRQKIIAIEQGSLAVSMGAYARALAALDFGLAVVPYAMLTLEEVPGLFE